MRESHASTFSFTVSHMEAISLTRDTLNMERNGKLVNRMDQCALKEYDVSYVMYIKPQRTSKQASE